MTVNSQRHSVLLDNVYSLIDKKVDAQQKSLVQQFGRLLYKNISNDDLENRNDSDLYGATLSLWSGLAKFKSTAPYIRVFNPEIEKHGWHSSHTIVEIIVNDMPFLLTGLISRPIYFYTALLRLSEMTKRKLLLLPSRVKPLKVHAKKR